MQLKISYSVNFKKAKLPSKKKLIGKYSILEPININKHLKDLFNNFSLDRTKMLWAYMPVGPFKNILSLYVDLGQRKVVEFDPDRIKIIDDFIKKNLTKFKSDKLIFSGKLKK